MKETVWCIKYIKEMTLRQKYKEVYELCRERNPVARINMDAKVLLNQKNYILKAQILTTVEIEKLSEIIRIKIWEKPHKITERRRKGQNGFKWYRIPQEKVRKRKH